MELRYPAAQPPWLPAFGSSIIRCFKGLMDAPFRLWPVASADLPTATDFTGGLVWNRTSLTINWSDGTSWKAPQPEDADLTAIAALGTTGLLARTGSGAWSLRSIAGTANEIAVANGGGVLGEPTLSLPAALTFTGKTVTGGTFDGGSCTNLTSLTVDGNATIGDASTDAHTVNGSLAVAGASIQLDNNQYLRGKIAAGTTTRMIGINAADAFFVGSVDAAVANMNFSSNGVTWAQLTSTGLSLLTGSAYKINNVQLVGARKTGWSAHTGTAKRSANATYSGTAEAGYTQATIQALMDAVRDNTQATKALIDDLHATAGHGLIGA